MKTAAKLATAALTTLAVISLSGCSGSVLFPARAVLPATLDEAYHEVQGKGESAEFSDPTRAFLTGFDPASARPTPPTRPIEPRPSALASERFTLADLGMPTRASDATDCTVIAAEVGGGNATCAEKGEAALADALPPGVPAGSYVVGKAFGDGRMILLNQRGEGGEMWDAAMHERGHLLASWLCGRADCLNNKLVNRGYKDSVSYLGSLTEGFAQSWAQCNGARKRSDYVAIKCTDIDAVVAAATDEKTAAKRDFEQAKKSYDEALASYQEQVHRYDDRLRQIDVLQRVRSAQAHGEGSTPAG